MVIWLNPNPRNVDPFPHGLDHDSKGFLKTPVNSQAADYYYHYKHVAVPRWFLDCHSWSDKLIFEGSGTYPWHHAHATIKLQSTTKINGDHSHVIPCYHTKDRLLAKKDFILELSMTRYQRGSTHPLLVIPVRKKMND